MDDRNLSPAAGGPAAAVALEETVFAWPGQSAATLDIPAFRVEPGEHVFIAGPSGSGKSTLLGLIAGILAPDRGTVSVNGSPISQWSGSRRDVFRGDNIGFIFQQFNLIPYLSILENVLIPCRLSAPRSERAGTGAENPLAAAKRLLERLDLSPDLWDRPVTKLSVGQQQRVAAARALIGRPFLLIADEPTSSLDADRREAFLELLLRESRAAGSTLLFVSHDLSLAAEFSRTVRLGELNQAGGEAS